MYKQEAHAEVRRQLCRNSSLLPHYVGSEGQTWVARLEQHVPLLAEALTISKERMHTGPSFDLVLNLHQKLLLSVRHYQQPEGSPYSTKCLLRVYVPPMQQRSVSGPVSTWTVNHSATDTFIERLDKGLLFRPLPWGFSWNTPLPTTVPWDLEKNSFGFGSMKKCLLCPGITYIYPIRIRNYLINWPPGSNQELPAITSNSWSYDPSHTAPDDSPAKIF